MITLQLDPDTVAEALDVRVEAASASGCLTTETATVALDVAPPEVALDVSGGCGCRMAGEPQPRGWWWLSLAMATGLWRRRRF